MWIGCLWLMIVAGPCVWIVDAVSSRTVEVFQVGRS